MGSPIMIISRIKIIFLKLNFFVPYKKIDEKFSNHFLTHDFGKLET